MSLKDKICSIAGKNNYFCKKDDEFDWRYFVKKNEKEVCFDVIILFWPTVRKLMYKYYPDIDLLLDVTSMHCKTIK